MNFKPGDAVLFRNHIAQIIRRCDCEQCMTRPEHDRGWYVKYKGRITAGAYISDLSELNFSGFKAVELKQE